METQMKEITPRTWCHNCQDAFDPGHVCGEKKPDEPVGLPPPTLPELEMTDEQVIETLTRMGLDPQKEADRLRKIIAEAIAKHDRRKVEAQEIAMKHSPSGVPVADWIVQAILEGMS